MWNIFVGCHNRSLNYSEKITRMKKSTNELLMDGKSINPAVASTVFTLRLKFEQIKRLLKKNKAK